MKPFPKVEKKITHCINCNKELIRNCGESKRDWVPRKTCGKKCYHEWYSGSKHPWFKSGYKHRPDGYVRDSKTDKYIHRSIMENKIGRALTKDEVVHHLNGDTSDNRIDNMILLTNSEHRKLHVKTQRRGQHGFIK